MTYLKFLFFAVSFFTAVLGVFSLNKLPLKKFSVKQNYLRISLFSTFGIGIDFVMFWIIVSFMQPGEYGTGIEIVAFVLTVIFYGIPCVVTSFFLKKRLKKYNDNQYNIAQISGLNISVLFKALFVFVWTIWTFEG